MNNKKPLPIQLVVGSHRSGTSFFTQILSLLGLDVGRSQMLPSFDNPRGFWENEKIVTVHAELLSSLGKDWTTAAFVQPNWLDTKAANKALNALQEILETDFQDNAPSLIKDPRLAILFPLWELLAKKLRRPLFVISILRSPDAVAASINRRNALPVKTGRLIALTYHQKMAEFFLDTQMPLIPYETLITLNAKEIVEALSRALPHLRLTITPEVIGIIDRLVIRDAPKKHFHSELQETYEKIIETAPFSLAWNDFSKYLKLAFSQDAVAENIEKISHLPSLLTTTNNMVSLPQKRIIELESKANLANDFEDTIIEERVIRIKFQKENEALVEKIAALAGGITERDTILSNVRKDIAKKEKEIAALADEITERDTTLSNVRKDIAKKEKEIAALAGGITERDTTLSNVRKDIAKKEKEIAALADGITERDTTLSNVRKDIAKKEKEIAALADEITEHDTTLSNVRKEIAALAGTISERDTTLSAARKDITKKEKEIAALAGEITERDTTLSNVRKDIAALAGTISERDTTLSAARKDITKKEKEIYKLSTKLSTEQKEKEDVQASLAEVSRLKEMQDLTIELDGMRSKMVEEQLEGKAKALAARLAYYENNPIKSGSKHAVLKTLQFVRHSFPMPETVKLSIARKFTSLSQKLRPPIQADSLVEGPPLATGTKINFSFKEVSNPVISIVVPVYNEISQTIACLQSIYQQQCSVDYEVILADDRSPDPFHKILKEIKGLRYFRNEKNLHFLLNCNRNAEHARGDYIVFLNNDTIVNPGWLQNLYLTFMEHGNVGVVGSKLVYPSGELQEAGGIVWEDASGWNWGKNQDPAHPQYNYVRDVDYVSGASLMVKADIWREVGGFFEGLEKAYYEDTDLCFRVRALGYRVLYQPQSTVIHIEGLSSGTDVTSGAKKYQLTNQKIFLETWKDTLRHHLPNGQTPVIASDRKVRGHILYIDATTPEPQKDAGSVNAFFSMRLLLELGYRVHFIPGSNFSHWGGATEELQKMGVECVYHPFYSNMDSFLNERGDMFEYVVISRAECNELFLKTVRNKCPRAKIINNTVDLHFLRMEREAKIVGNTKLIEAAKTMRRKELSFMRAADATIVLSEVEHAILAKQKTLKDKLWTIPLIRPHSSRLVTYDNTQDIVFVGGYRHAPNVDAAEWLVTKIWPKIRKLLPGVKLRICGSSMPSHFKKFACDDIVIEGFVPDLDNLLSQTRLTIAPLRYGAGLKGKVASSIGVGVPCIGTPIAFEGMGETNLSDVKLVASTAKGLADLIKKYYLDEKLWTDVSKAGVLYHNANYAYQNISKDYSKLLESLK